MRFRDSRYNRHNARVRSVRKSRFLYPKYLLVLFVPGYLAMRHAITGLLLDILQITVSWLKIPMVEKLISKVCQPLWVI